HNLIRGLSPYPAAFSTITDSTKEIDMKIYGAVPVEQSKGNINQDAVGKILTDKKSFIHVICSDGHLALEEIQLAGKKRMKVKDFLLGFRDIEKFRFI
ncbi:MAG: methionyl-tRNA formyltransferase, partial [Bacteroidales bacterium]|nr:methionyl-tRNA formyltransferase [Bacteroidales bacterium]